MQTVSLRYIGHNFGFVKDILSNQDISFTVLPKGSGCLYALIISTQDIRTLILFQDEKYRIWKKRNKESVYLITRYKRNIDDDNWERVGYGRT